MSKYLVLDCETGGFEGTSLLSVYLGVYSEENFTLLDELEMFMRPKDHIYMITAEALTVNGINLIEHETKAIPYQEAGTKLYNFLERNSIGTTIDISKKDESTMTITEQAYRLYKELPKISYTIEKLSPLGHNVGGDIRLMKEFLVSPGTWDKFVSYRVEDTGTVGNFLKRQGKIPKDISGSLSSYAKYFNIDSSKAHDAKGDVNMTVQVYEKMLKL